MNNDRKLLAISGGLLFGAFDYLIKLIRFERIGRKRRENIDRILQEKAEYVRKRGGR